MSGPVERWLETFMCKQYAETFEKCGYKTLSSVCQLDRHTLRSMGVLEEHCDNIIENVSVLRQTIVGKANLDKQAGSSSSLPPFQNFSGMPARPPGHQFFSENQPYNRGEFPHGQMSTPNPPGSGDVSHGMSQVQPGHWQQQQQQQQSQRAHTVQHLPHSPPGQSPTSHMPPPQPFPSDQYGQYDSHVAQPPPPPSQQQQQQQQQQSQYYTQQQQYMAQQQNIHPGYRDQQPPSMVSQYPPHQYYSQDDQYQYGPHYQGGNYGPGYPPQNSMGYNQNYNMASPGQMHTVRGYNQSQTVGTSPPQQQPSGASRYRSMVPSPSHSTSPSMMQSSSVYQQQQHQNAIGHGITGGNNNRNPHYVYSNSPLGQPGSHPSPVPSPATSIRSPVSIHSPNSVPSRSPAPSPITVRSPLCGMVQSPAALPSPGSSNGSVKSPLSVPQKSPNNWQQPVSPVGNQTSYKSVPHHQIPNGPYVNPNGQQISPTQHDSLQNKGALPRLEEMVAFLGEPKSKGPAAQNSKEDDGNSPKPVDQVDGNQHEKGGNKGGRDSNVNTDDKLNDGEKRRVQSHVEGQSRKRTIEECECSAGTEGLKKNKVESQDSKKDDEKTVENVKKNDNGNKDKPDVIVQRRANRGMGGSRAFLKRIKSDVSDTNSKKCEDSENHSKDKCNETANEKQKNHNVSPKSNASNQEQKKLACDAQEKNCIDIIESGKSCVKIVLTKEDLIKDGHQGSIIHNRMRSPLKKVPKNGKSIIPISVDCSGEGQQITVSRETCFIEEHEIEAAESLVEHVMTNDNRVANRRHFCVNEKSPKGKAKAIGNCGTEHGCPGDSDDNEKDVNKKNSLTSSRHKQNSKTVKHDLNDDTGDNGDSDRNPKLSISNIKQETTVFESDSSSGSSIDLLCRESDFGSSDSRSGSPNIALEKSVQPTHDINIYSRFLDLPTKTKSKLDKSLNKDGASRKIDGSVYQRSKSKSCNPILTPVLRKLQRKQCMSNIRSDEEIMDEGEKWKLGEKSEKLSQGTNNIKRSVKKEVNLEVPMKTRESLDDRNNIVMNADDKSVCVESDRHINENTSTQDTTTRVSLKEESWDTREQTHDDTTTDHPPKKKRGRPLGSKNKIKTERGAKRKSAKHEFSDKVDETPKRGRKKKHGLDIPRRLQGPLIRIRGSEERTLSLTVVNNPMAEAMEKILASKKKNKTQVLSSAVNNDRPALLKPTSPPVVSSNTIFTYGGPWHCAFCGKISSYDTLGDLYGPYYPPGHKLPKVEPKTPLDTLTVDTGSTKKRRSRSRSRSEDSAALSPPLSSRGRTKSGDKRIGKPPKWLSDSQLSVVYPTMPKPDKGKSSARGKGSKKMVSPLPSPAGSSKCCKSDSDEMWVHEDCSVWADGVYMAGPNMYGLHDAVRVAKQMTCCSCQQKGASLGCMTKGCEEKYHYLCAVHEGCQLQEENFSMLCPKHKNKTIKMKDLS
ncbi:uncharacterized protein LOC100378749 [Saccoglossus kowalevskii]|uniref:Transcription factor 20-like n=1 Tax=Saccoglossus kowalevskii TaxID=10224 RepID=A0ABM0H1Y0_SACKO|nr:PREDICTED: transcription factor 20-like [Saccoglossus kowalevskii]